MELYGFKAKKNTIRYLRNTIKYYNILYSHQPSLSKKLKRVNFLQKKYIYLKSSKIKVSDIKLLYLLYKLFILTAIGIVIAFWSSEHFYLNILR